MEIFLKYMKTKNSIKAFIILLVMCCVSLPSFAGVIIIPPMSHGGGGGGGVNKEAFLGVWLVINLFFIIYFIGKLIFYNIYKTKITWTEKWWRFLISDDMLNINIEMMVLIGLNGFILFIATVAYIVPI